MASEGGGERQRQRQSLRWSGKQRAGMELKVCVSVTYVSMCVPICMQVHTHVCVCVEDIGSLPRSLSTLLLDIEASL